MFIQKIFAHGLLILLFVFHGKASDVLVLNQESAIQLALENNLELRTAQAAIQVAEARRDNTGLAEDPTVSIKYASDYLFNDEGEHTVGLSFSKRFPLANRLNKEKKLSAFIVEAAKLERAQARLKIIATIMELSLEIQLLDTNRRHIEAIEAKTSEILRFTRSQAEIGEGSPLQVNQVSIELAALQQKIIHVTHEREDLTYELAREIGLDPKLEVSFLETPKIEITGGQKSFDPKILERHPGYQLATLASQSADAAHELALSQNWDDLTTRLFWENERSVDLPIGLKTDRFIGVEFSIPLPLQKKGQRISREKILEKAQSEQRAGALKLRIHHEVKNAYRETIHAQELLESFTQNLLVPSEQNYKDINQAHQNGQLGLFEALSAQRQIIALDEQHIAILEEYARAALKLKLARIDLPTTQL